MENKLIVPTNNDEQPYVLEDLDRLLARRRGYTFHTPTPDDSVVFIISGGLDSTIALHRVLNEIRCTVYPLYIKRGARSEDSELNAIKHYMSLYSELFPEKLRPLTIIASEVPPKILKTNITKDRLSTIGHPMRNAVLQSISIQFAVAKSHEDQAEIKTVFTAISPDDMLPHCSLVALRAQTLLACIDNGDWAWQITSPNLEPELWGDISKSDSIKYATQHKIPLDMTYTCTQGPTTACGICPECHLRIEAFQQAGVPDPTEYGHTS
ncbi:hypothetical protein E6P97_01235 [Patescibacteria group bacterium]|nr:MAG: hypothetical protein E6P97_01235 [Patescibacteria group bacterium]